MRKTVFLVFILIGLSVLGVFGYSYLHQDFYSKHQMSFGDMKEKLYNGETFMAVFYKPSCDVCDKAKEVYQVLAEKEKVDVVTVDVTSVDQDARDPILDDEGIPRLYYFVDGQKVMVLAGYYPLDVYEKGLENMNQMLKEESGEE